MTATAACARANGTTTEFLVDVTATWPQVVVEKTAVGQSTQNTLYVWGIELQQQIKGPGAVAATPTGS